MYVYLYVHICVAVAKCSKGASTKYMKDNIVPIN